MEEQNLDQIEKLLTQSVNGHHYLFETCEIAQILSTPTEEIDFFSFENMDRVQNLFSELINRLTFAEKKMFLSTLDKESYEILVRAYFHILENTILASTKVKH